MQNLSYIDRMRLAKGDAEPSMYDVALNHAKASTTHALHAHAADHPVVAAQKHAAAKKDWAKVKSVAAALGNKTLHAHASNMERGHGIMADRKAKEFAPAEIGKALSDKQHGAAWLRLHEGQIPKEITGPESITWRKKGGTTKDKTVEFRSEDHEHFAHDAELKHHHTQAESHLAQMGASKDKATAAKHGALTSFHSHMANKRKHEIAAGNREKSDNFKLAQKHRNHAKVSQAVAQHHYHEAHKSLKNNLQKGEVMDFNDFFKSEDVCGECGSTLEKAHGPTKGSVAEDNKKSKKHAGAHGSGHLSSSRGKGGNSHKQNDTEKSETAGTETEETFQKAFPVSDDFRAVEYVNDNGKVFSDLSQFK